MNNSIDSLPLVSVCSLVYNHEPYLRQCLDGFVMQQTNFRFEVIIHDDASTDGSADIIREYETKYPEIFRPIYQTENQYCKGKGILVPIVYPKCRGKYIALCEGDDYWTDPLKLQKQVDFLEANPEYSMCFHNVQVTSEGTQLDVDIYNHLRDKDYSLKEFIERWTIPTCSVVFKSYISKHIPQNAKFAVGDNVLFTTCAIYGKVRCINERMGCYRRNAGGWTNVLDGTIPLKMIKHYDAMIEAFPQVNKNLFIRCKAEHTFYYAYFLLKQRRIRDFSITVKNGLLEYGSTFISVVGTLVTRKIKSTIQIQ